MFHNYFQVAKDNEGVFRNILRDMKDNREQRPMGFYVPKDLETEAELETIFGKYSSGDRFGIFTITDFIIEDDVATIEFEDLAVLSGGGAELRYSVNGDAVKYLGSGFVMMS